MRSQEAYVAADLDDVYHIAIPVEDIDEAVSWYSGKFSCRVLWRDDTLALLEFGNAKVAFVLPGQQPPRIDFERPDTDTLAPLRTRRDGTRSTPVSDLAGNSLGILSAAGVAR